MQSLTKDQQKDLAQCANMETLLFKLEKMGIKATAQEAKTLFAQLRAPQALDDDSLDKVAGGYKRR